MADVTELLAKALMFVVGAAVGIALSALVLLALLCIASAVMTGA